MPKPVQRVAILGTALLFLSTSVAFTVAVVLQMRKDSKDANNQTNVTQTNPATQDQPEGANMLQGTKLEEFEPVPKVDQLSSVDRTEGTGEVVPAGAKVVAHYTGALAADGTIFQSSHDSGQPVPFGLSEVIAGWTQGVPGMKVGGKRRLLIPAGMAYGAEGRPGIPPNADLVFDIEIVSIEK